MRVEEFLECVIGHLFKVFGNRRSDYRGYILIGFLMNVSALLVISHWRLQFKSRFFFRVRLECDRAHRLSIDPDIPG